jgi:hypothetical protein
MDRTYDIFELLPDESLLWKACVFRAQDVAGLLADIGRKTPNECFAINIDTKEIIARVNVKPRGPASVKSAESARRLVTP